MAVATRNGSGSASTSQIMRWVNGLDAESITTGDVMGKFRLSRGAAQGRLRAIADEGLLVRTGTGRGARYHKPQSNGDGASKPILAASELPFIGKLAADCDQELQRIDSEIAALASAREELLAQEAKLREERKGVERAREVLS
jgi:hypothetical protein